MIVETSSLAWRSCSSFAFRCTSASTLKVWESCLLISQDAKAAIFSENSAMDNATSVMTLMIIVKAVISCCIPLRCLETMSMALTRPRNCDSRLSRYAFLLSNHYNGHFHHLMHEKVMKSIIPHLSHKSAGLPGCSQWMPSSHLAHEQSQPSGAWSAMKQVNKAIMPLWTIAHI